jgi:hypothetical protein
MRLRYIIIGTVLVILSILGIFKLYDLYHRPLTHHLNADLQWLGLIDLDNAQDITIHGVQEGEDVVLVVDHALELYQGIVHKIPQAKYLTQEEVFNINNLHLFDTNNDGKITENDPIFKHLFVISFYNKGNQSDIKSLNAVGIKSIKISNTPTGDHLVEMQDGTTRRLIGTNKLDKNQ